MSKLKQLIHLRFGLFWTMRSLCEAAIVAFSIIILVALGTYAGWAWAGDMEVAAQSKHWQKEAEAWQKTLLGAMNGKPIGETKSYSGVREVYYCDLKMQRQSKSVYEAW